MTGLRAEVVRVAAWPATRRALAATLALSGLVCLLVGIVAPRLAPAERGAAAALLDPATAHVSLVLLLVAFGGPLAAALAGAIGAAARAARRDPARMAGGAGEPAGPATAVGALAVLALGGLLVAYAWGVGVLGIGAWLGGRAPAPLLDPAAAIDLAALARGWLAVVALAAVGYAAGALTGHRLAGLAAIGILILAELVAGAADPASPLLGVAPISHLADLAGGGPGEALPAAAVAAACVAGALAAAAAGRRRGRPRRPAR